MKRQIPAVILTILVSIVPSVALAQIRATGPVVNGHYHLNASDRAAHKRFWVDALGGKVGTFGNDMEIYEFPDALIFLRDQAPTAGTIGSTVNHIGFSVPDLRPVVDRIKANGFRMVTAEEAPPGVPVENDIGMVEGGGPVSGIAYALGPDEVKVEVLEMKAQTEPIMSNHVHFFGPDQQAMRAWYVKVFGATERPGQVNGIVGADLPGLGLSFSNAPGPVAGTQGRAIDHIGFEIDDLEAFTKRLQAQGITLDVPYRNVEALGLAIAFVSDPWGTSIELTEGLDKLR